MEDEHTMENGHVHGPDCDHEHEELDELTTEDVVDQNDILLHALIDLLIEKKVIQEEEFQSVVKEFIEAASAEEEEDDEE